jgi:hypothetical protein
MSAMGSWGVLGVVLDIFLGDLGINVTDPLRVHGPCYAPYTNPCAGTPRTFAESQGQVVLEGSREGHT